MSRLHDTSMQSVHYMYDMYGRPLYDVQGRPMVYGHQRAPTPIMSLLKGEGQVKKVKEPPRATSFKGRKVSPLGWISWIMAILAFVMSLLSCYIPLWATFIERNSQLGDRTVGFGLWHRCARSVEANSWEICDGVWNTYLERRNKTGTPGWFNGCRATAILALGCTIGTVVLLSMYIFGKKYNRKKWVSSAALIVAFIAGLLEAVLCVMFGVLFLKNIWWEANIYYYGLSYCFGIACAAGVFAWTTAVCVGCELNELII